MEKKTKFEACYGEIHMLLGDAGAGKSALLAALKSAWKRGMHSVHIPCERQEDEENNDSDAALGTDLKPPPGAQGVEWLAAEPMLIEDFTVLDNLMLGRENTYIGFLSRSRARRRAQRLCERYKLEIPLETRVEKLDMQTRLSVALLRLIYRDGELLIFDDVTLRATPQVAAQLAGVARQLAQEGRAVVWATRDAREAARYGTRVTVLRRGKSIGEAGKNMPEETMLRAYMNGGSEEGESRKQRFSSGRAVLVVRNLTVRERHADQGRKCEVNNASFSVREGEILAILSLPGNGEVTLARALAGFARAKSGQIFMGAQEITHLSAGERFENGMGYLPEECTMGLVNGMTLRENLILRSFRSPRFAPYGFLKREPIDAFAQERCARFDLPGSASMPDALTAGERVRAVLARETAPGIRLLIAQEPTRALEMPERERIYEILRSERDHAHGILLFTTFVREALELCDRILVLYQGQFVAEVDAQNATSQELGLYMSGMKRARRE